MTASGQANQRRGCSGFALFVLALLLILALPLSLLLFNVGRVVFNAGLVKRVTADVLVHSDIIPAGLEWYGEWRAQERYDQELARPWEGEPDIVQLMTFLDAADWRIIKQEVLLDEYVISWSGSAIDGVYAWIDSSDPLPTVTLDMADFKDHARGEHGENALDVAYDALPYPCTSLQMADFNDRLSKLQPGEETLYNLCHFDPPWEQDQHDDYLRSLDDTLDAIPDQWNLVQEMNADGLVLLENTPPTRVKNILRAIRAIMRWSVLVPVILIVLLIWGSAQRHVGHGLWLGIPIFFGGLLALIVAVFNAPLITQLATAIPLRRIPPLALDEGTLFLLALARPVSSLMIVMAALAMVIGAVVLVAGRRWFRRPPEEAPPEPDTLVTTP